VGDPETRFVGVPSRNVTLHVNYAGGAPEGQGQATHPGEAFSLSFFRGAEATPTYLASLHSGDTVTFDGVGYRVVFDYDAGVRLNSRLWWVAVAVGWGMTALSLAMLIVAPPVYAQAGLLATAEGSRVRLTVDVLGDEQRRHRELRALVAPEV
jgi:hypothetical protein